VVVVFRAINLLSVVDLDQVVLEIIPFPEDLEILVDILHQKEILVVLGPVLLEVVEEVLQHREQILQDHIQTQEFLVEMVH
jgi:hypothetical protein